MYEESFVEVKDQEAHVISSKRFETQKVPWVSLGSVKIQEAWCVESEEDISLQVLGMEDTMKQQEFSSIKLENDGPQKCPGTCPGNTAIKVEEEFSEEMEKRTKT